MLLCIDIGNTNIVFAVCDQGDLKQSWRCRTHNASSMDEYAAFLGPLLSMSGLEWDNFTDIIIGSVVPEANRHVVAFCKTYLKLDPLFVTKDNVKIKIDLDRPEEAGADRLINALAVSHFYNAPAIVVDFGTSTTFDVVLEKGHFSGGAIAPGINLSVSALTAAASKLPKIDIQKPACALGKSTVHAMQSGLYWGYVGLIEKILEQIIAEIGEKPRVIATGGLAPVFKDDISMIGTIDSDLTIKGLLQFYKDMQ